MAPEVIEIAKWVAAVAGAILAVWQVSDRVHKAIIADLADYFASKDDLGRLEKKVDTLLAISLRGAHRRGKSNES